MKKLTLILFLTLISSSSLFSQEITEDVEFLKANLFLQNAVITYEEIYNNQNEDFRKKIEDIKSNINLANKHYFNLKHKNYENEIFATFVDNLQVLEKCIELLESNDPTWTLGYTLAKLNLQDFVNNELN